MVAFIIYATRGAPLQTRARTSLAASVVAVVLLTVAAAPASAGQVIYYRGTMAGERMDATVIKRDSGRLFLSSMSFGWFDVTCEDGSGFVAALTLISAGTLASLDEERGFEVDFKKGSQMAIHVEGRLGWARGNGTFTFNRAELTDDGDAQLCTSGDLPWNVHRTGSAPAAVPLTNPPPGAVHFQVTVNADGSQTVKIRSPRT